MAKNFAVKVSNHIPYSKVAQAEVVVKTMLEATGLASTNLSKDRMVQVWRTVRDVTHRTRAAAQAFVEVELFDLVPSG